MKNSSAILLQPGQSPMPYGTSRRSPKRAGYTLTEMLVVAGVVAALAALSWPVLRRPLNKSRLRAAAKQVRIELAKTRLKAIQTGVTHRFRYQPGNNVFEIAPLQTENGAETPAYGWVEDDTSHAGSPVNSAGASSPEEQAVHKQLPDGVLFVDPSLTAEMSDVDQPRPEPEAVTAVDEPDWSAPIIFHPNGRAKDAHIVLLGQRDFQIGVTLRGLTGVVAIGELQRREEGL